MRKGRAHTLPILSMQAGDIYPALPVTDTACDPGKSWL